MENFEFGSNIWKEILEEKDKEGDNILMELAKNMKDDALREILTNTATYNYVSKHSCLKYLRDFLFFSLSLSLSLFFSLL